MTPRPSGPASTRKDRSWTGSSSPRGSSTTSPPDEGPTGGRIDRTGRYINVPPRSVLTIGLYLVLAGVLLAYSGDLSSPSVTALLAVVILFFLVRYLSTYYVIDDESLYARRLIGSRRVRLAEVRQVEITNLRDLGPVGLFGTWGYRGRVWSPTIGDFETIHTSSPGVLISAGKFPLFVSPKDPVGFARELSRRARSYGVELDPDPPMLSARAVYRG